MRPGALLLSCALALAAGSTHAEVKSFLLIPGVPGESTYASHPKWIELTTVSVGVADRACTGVVVTKPLDKSSPLLSGAALFGSVYPEMTVDVVRVVAGTSEVFLSYTLSSVTVGAVNAMATATLPVVETVHLSPNTVKMVYTPQSAGGAIVDAVSFTLPCAKK